MHSALVRLTLSRERVHAQSVRARTWKGAGAADKKYDLHGVGTAHRGSFKIITTATGHHFCVSKGESSRERVGRRQGA